MSLRLLTELESAIYFGDIGEINRLLDMGIKITEMDFETAIAIGNFRIINTLLDRGAKIDFIHFREACSRGYLDIIKILLERGFDINSTDFFEETVLFKLIRKVKHIPTFISVVKFLWSCGININIPNYQKKTALMIAKELNDLAYVNLLQSYTDKMTLARLCNAETANLVGGLYYDLVIICASYLG
jgi:hypothetical protein